MGPILIFLAREPHVHGYETLQNVIDKADAIVKEQGALFAAFQSNHEGCDR